MAKLSKGQSSNPVTIFFPHELKHMLFTMQISAEEHWHRNTFHFDLDDLRTACVDGVGLHSPCASVLAEGPLRPLWHDQGRLQQLRHASLRLNRHQHLRSNIQVSSHIQV